MCNRRILETFITIYELTFSLDGYAQRCVFDVCSVRLEPNTRRDDVCSKTSETEHKQKKKKKRQQSPHNNGVCPFIYTYTDPSIS